jgi:hypothetical protein
VSFAFVKGGEVVLRARPDSGTGVVTDVLIAGSEPQYKLTRFLIRACASLRENRFGTALEMKDALDVLRQS